MRRYVKLKLFEFNFFFQEMGKMADFDDFAEISENIFLIFAKTRSAIDLKISHYLDHRYDSLEFKGRQNWLGIFRANDLTR